MSSVEKPELRGVASSGLYVVFWRGSRSGSAGGHESAGSKVVSLANMNGILQYLQSRWSQSAAHFQLSGTQQMARTMLESIIALD
jgi:hypothetical protein